MLKICLEKFELGRTNNSFQSRTIESVVGTYTEVYAMRTGPNLQSHQGTSLSSFTININKLRMYLWLASLIRNGKKLRACWDLVSAALSMRQQPKPVNNDT